MSNPSQSPGASYAAPPVNPSNTAGLVGFLLTLLTCGFLSPIGLIVSLIGLRKSPKIFAILGTVLGMLGVLGYCAAGVAIYGAQRAGAYVATDLLISVAVAKINDYKAQNNGQIPDEIEGMKMLVDMKDSWGQSLRYDREGNSFKIRSAGRDKTFDTPDDMLSKDFLADEGIELEVGTGGDMDGPVTIPGEGAGPVVIPPVESEDPAAKDE